MPFSYTVANAIALVSAFTKNTPTSVMQITAADLVSSQIWCAAPWQWTLQQISPSIALVDGTQDYSVPSELYRVVHLRITRTDVTTEQPMELDMVKWLPPATSYTTGHRSMRLFCQELTLGKFRLEQAVQVVSPLVLQLDGEYQANPTAITLANYTNPLWIPDQYFNVYEAGLLYYFYKFTDDARAGSILTDKRGNAQYTGQYGVWMNELDRMMEAEDLKTGNDIIFPTVTLGGGGTGWNPVYGYG